MKNKGIKSGKSHDIDITQNKIRLIYLLFLTE